LLVAGFALAFLSSAAQAGTVLQFGQTNPVDVITATESGGVTTFSTAGNVDGAGVSVPVIITNLFGTPLVGIPAFETFVGVHSVGPATPSGGQIFQNVVGTIEITSAPGGVGTNYLTAVFNNTASPGLASGTAGGAQAQLYAAGPPVTLSFTSMFAMLIAPTSMTVGFSNVAPLFTDPDSSISSFTAQNAGTFSAAVPEPATIGMACMGAAFVSLAIRCNRRMRRKEIGQGVTVPRIEAPSATRCAL
jgi:hypothetical protein